MKELNEYIIEKLKINSKTEFTPATVGSIDDILEIMDDILEKDFRLNPKYYYLNRVDTNHRQIQWTSAVYKEKAKEIATMMEEFLKKLSLEFKVDVNKYSTASIVDIFITDKSIDDTYEKD